MAIGISDNSQVLGGLGVTIDNEAKVALTTDPAKAGIVLASSIGEQYSRANGSYQDSYGDLVSGTVTTGTLVKPTAVIPANDSLTAGLCDSLGGRSWETLTTGLALNTDAMLQAYQVPAGVRLKIEGVKLTASVQTVLAGGPFVNEFHLAFGFTGAAPSLQAAEAPNRVLLPELTQLAAAAQAVGTALSQPGGAVARFANPVFVDAGEWVALVVNRMGTAATSGVIAYGLQYDFSLEAV